jgi:hypothetical protein
LIYFIVGLENNKSCCMKTKYLTKAHQENSEAAIKQIKEWKKLPTDFEKLLKQMRENATDNKTLTLNVKLS